MVKKIYKLLIFLYLILFPLGQLPGFFLQLYLDLGIRVHLTDLVLVLLFLLRLIFAPKLKSSIFTYLILLVFIFSLIISLRIFSLREIEVGFLYLIRFTSYFYLADTLFRFKKFIKIKTIKKYLEYIIYFVVFSGFVQYLIFSDVRGLKQYNWDDHYFRLVGTFLDPSFTAIILVLGFLYFFYYKKYNSSSITLLAIGLTYSRASFLALFISLIYLFLKKKDKITLYFLVGFVFLIMLLPRPGGEGVKLERTHSIYLKLENFSEGLRLWSNSPFLGIGFNNVCIAKQKFLGSQSNLESHSCSGLDNSFLFVLVTTGVFGLLITTLWAYFISSHHNFELLKTASIAVLIHSLFTNTLFYPWVAGWLIFLSFVALKENKSS